MYIKNSFIIPQLCLLKQVGTKIFHEIKESAQCVNYSLVKKTDIEDEYQFILICPTYRGFRKKFIKKYYWSNPSVYKFVQILSANNVRDLCNMGKYIKKAFEKKKIC